MTSICGVRSAIAIERATGEDAKAVEASVPVAEYVRMSTDNQKYSIQNQSQVIRAYAQARGMSVIRTYSDAGKSGLSLNGRNGLKQLLEDAQTLESRISDYSCLRREPLGQISGRGRKCVLRVHLQASRYRCRILRRAI